MTLYALVVDGQIEAVGGLPASACRLDTEQWVMGLATAPSELRDATGWLEVVDTARPDDTATTTHDRSVELVNGVPTVVWAERTLTDDEQFAREQAQAPDLTTAIAARLLANDEPAPWQQPTGAHDAYLPGAIVLDANGDRWRNDLGTANVWPIDNLHARWTNLDYEEPAEPQPWVQPTGVHDAYAAGAVVTHNGATWDNTHGNGNSWEPGVYGWTAR